MSVKHLLPVQRHEIISKVEQRKQVGRVPLRTLRELAEEFGLTPTKLSREMGKSPDAPHALTKPSNQTNLAGCYFNPAEMRAWWKKHNEGNT